MSARRLDVDHVVPLAWAWNAGAWRWTPERRREFANDPASLAVEQALRTMEVATCDAWEG